MEEWPNQGSCCGYRRRLARVVGGGRCRARRARPDGGAGGYRLSHQATWPAQLADVRAAAREPMARARATGLPFLVAGVRPAAICPAPRLRGVTEPGDVARRVAFWPPVDPLAEDWSGSCTPCGPATTVGGNAGPRPRPRSLTRDATRPPSRHRVPVLLVHGTEDTAVPASQTVS